MKLLVIGNEHDALVAGLRADGHEVDTADDTAEGYDLAILYRHRKILTTDQIDRCPVINAHPSLLPWGRGAHPIFWALVENRPLGVSVHYVTATLDKGPLITQRAISMHEGVQYQSYRSLRRHLYDNLTNLVIEVCREPEIKAISAPLWQRGDYHALGDFLLRISPCTAEQVESMTASEIVRTFASMTPARGLPTAS